MQALNVLADTLNKKLNAKDENQVLLLFVEYVKIVPELRAQWKRN